MQAEAHQNSSVDHTHTHTPTARNHTGNAPQYCWRGRRKRLGEESTWRHAKRKIDDLLFSERAIPRRHRHRSCSCTPDDNAHAHDTHTRGGAREEKGRVPPPPPLAQRTRPARARNLTMMCTTTQVLPRRRRPSFRARVFAVSSLPMEMEWWW